MNTRPFLILSCSPVPPPLQEPGIATFNNTAKMPHRMPKISPLRITWSIGQGLVYCCRRYLQLQAALYESTCSSIKVIYWSLVPATINRPVRVFEGGRRAAGCCSSTYRVLSCILAVRTVINVLQSVVLLCRSSKYCRRTGRDSLCAFAVPYQRLLTIATLLL